ncbi:hypothetical protein LTS07_005173 [Exophiala sideris]|uniref:Uncharacterized protein n=1 Tax=Exophiala sideris TaxID=1016849 RepID=A0ABR0JBA8_9EURO|nr:hypothetical protein LTS07_005173 [Exophiala sideris]KAK5038442.1 hypothetical protein LTR13_004189 [Exophiala sideris]KAK5060325.1 hypothetical protein LTR69_005642 [Exophiala sideris]KAK5183235.1 hypothetical protein LTR44_004236 [Eurotiomycetes sp. CCFEE 6388]
MSIRPWSAAERPQYSPNSPITFLPPPPPRRDGRPAVSPARPASVLGLSSFSIDTSSPQGILTETPISATSLRGQYSPSYVPSPGLSPQTRVPMAARSSGHYNVPYDPRQWAGESRPSSTLIESRDVGSRPQDDVSSPPPPYSAPPAEAAALPSAGSTISPADSTFTAGGPSRSDTPTSVLSPLNPASHSVDDSALRFSSGHAAPRGNHARSRPASSIGAIRPASAISLSINTAAAQQSFASSTSHQDQYDTRSIPRPPAAKRAASTGAVSSQAALDATQGGSSSRSSSRQPSWQPGMPLPGPPPGPPPSSSRSKSATGDRVHPAAQASGPSGRPQHRRASYRAPILSPFPPTPANWRDESISRANHRTPIALHIDTSNLGRIGPTPPGLSRSAALRVSSAKGLLEHRKHRQSSQEEELSALTIETEPWSEMRSPSSMSFDRSPTLESLLTGPSSPATDRRGLRGASKRPLTPMFPVKASPTPPSSHRNPASAHSALPSNAPSVFEMAMGEPDGFIEEASRRHREFLDHESRADTDLERLELFVEFVTAEFQIRRTRYPTPFEDGSFNFTQTMDRLFAETEDGTTQTSRLSKDRSTIAGKSGELPQNTETGWWKDYRPALSPIASMSNDELSSRGRTASRWYQSQSGSEKDGAANMMTRTKRESKYMGLPSLSVEEVLSEVATPPHVDEVYGTEETYPEEKANPSTFGIYEDEGLDQITNDTPRQGRERPGLDISRFITLPPPYPRHHPAVNNSHPTLSSYRKAVRKLSDLNEIERCKSRYRLSVDALRQGHKQKIAEGQKAFKTNIQVQVAEGSITYAEAAEAEQALRVEENAAEKACLQAEFDALQDMVINPMHDMLNDRASQLNKQINELSEKLVDEMHALDLDRPQQEGDAMPETLEYLTQLKWLFESRENIHREIFHLLHERNDKYKAIVLLPYHQVGNVDKVRDTEDFFARDSSQRCKEFEEEALRRYQAFVNLVAENVGQEVELQSSAFWDIAPGLLDLVQRIPGEIDHLGPIAIPQAEYSENPVYHEYPQQYLYSLLDHAEKSTYQFIESQINLQCLLHEVRDGLLGAECRAAEASRARVQIDGPVSEFDLKEMRRERAESATADLKQQVSMIEEQWLEALGSALQSKKRQVKAFLEVVGGWDESLQAGG